MIIKFISALITAAVCFGIGATPNLVNRSTDNRDSVKTVRISEAAPADKSDVSSNIQPRTADVLLDGTAAEDIALDHLGLLREDVHFDRSDLDIEGGYTVWEIELYCDRTEYDLVIDAVSGEVLYSEADSDRRFSPTDDLGTDVPLTELTEDEAVKIALDHEGLTVDDVNRVRVRKDRDDGVWIYEVEFSEGRTEYDYDIRVSDGKILDLDRDYDD